MMRLAAAVLLAGPIFAGSAPAAYAETATGAAYVTTLPSGADIWVDGTYVGRAPVLVDALLAGHHEVTITKSGWVVQEVDVVVPAGSVALSSTRLAAGPRALAGGASGTVVVRNVPHGALLAFDNGPALRESPGHAYALAAGPHHISMTTAAGKTTLAFTVLPDTSTDLVLAEPHSKDAPSAVVAPADDYLPDGSIDVEGKKIVVRYQGHVAVARFGETMARLDGESLDFDGAPESIGGRVYLPLALLEKLTALPAKMP
jgi:hypothetical protein